MDPPPAPAGAAAAAAVGGGGRRRGVAGVLLRCCSGIVFSVAASFFVSFAVGIVAIVVGTVSSSSPVVSVPAACRILSTNVDLRSSKVCELGMWNFKASNILYTSGRTGFRCRDDYYWTSVLEVEYREYFSGQIVHAMAETPKQALPPDCRPSFGFVWSNKMRFKVNETYGCTYTLGSRKAEIDSADVFGCPTKDPSMAEMARRYFMLLNNSLLMESAFGNFLTESSWSDNMFAPQTIQRCPFLRNINEPTIFSLASVNIPSAARGVKSPIFEDGPNFETAFRLFHGKDGVVPLSGREYIHNDSVERKPAPQFNPLAAKAATISLSSFGFGGPFGFDFFSKKLKQNKKSSRREPSSEKGADSAHEALSNEWLETGQCPIAKSFRAVKFVVPLVAKALQPPPGMKYKCPPAIVAARAALARTAFVRDLRPQPLPAKMLNIALLGMAANVPLGVWREHTKKFSPQWFVAIHAAVPFIAMLRKAVLMPKTAMVITIAASILGQTIGSRAERIRLKAVAARSSAVVATVATQSAGGHCGEERVWDPLLMKSGGVGSPSAPASRASACY